MHIFLLFLAFLLGSIQAKPNGYYHSEASYHQESASYRNNELQHQNADDGFYSEHGDLEHKTKPKVNSYNQHSEYVNPKLKTGEYSANHQGIDSGLYANSDSYASGSSYRAGARAYGQAANLEELTQRLQADLSRQLQSAVSEQYAHSSAYTHSSTQMNQDLRRFEAELRANLTRKLQEALSEAYGRQAIRGPYSYSITRGGDTSRTANYNVEDLENLKRQLENNLVNELEQEVRTRYEASESRSSSFSSSNNQQGGGRYRPVALTADLPVSGVKTARRPTNYYPNNHYPSSYDQSGAFSESSSTNFASSDSVTYRLTDIVHDVQLDLSRVIDEILAEEQRKNSELIESGVRPNYDQNFQFLRQALIRNISDRIDEKINRYYGRQIERDDQFYSITASGSTKTQPNYSRDYLDDLKQQIEDNLVEKLSYGIRQQASRYDDERQRYLLTRRPNAYGHTSSSSSSSFHSASQYGGGVSAVAPLNTDQYNTRRPNYYNNNHPDSEVELTNIQQQLQNDLSRQLQYAIREQTKEYSAYASSGSVGSSNYQTALQQLSDELKRNLTEQLQRYLTARKSSSYSYTSGSQANFNQQQLEDVSRSLQDNLLRQLQDGLRQSWSSQYSYSASSSYTRPSSYNSGVKGHRAQSYTQQYGEDCDENGHYRRKRAIVLHNRAETDDLTQQLEDFGLTQQQEEEDFYNHYEPLSSKPGFGAVSRQKPSEKLQNSAELDQQQQLEDVYGNYREKRTTEANIFQQESEDGLTQQLEDENLHEIAQRPGYYQQQQQAYGKHPQSDDLTQQQETEDIYGNLELSKPGKNHQQQVEFITMKPTTQANFPQTEIGWRSTTKKPSRYFQTNLNPEDLTQQQETENFGFDSRRRTTTRRPNRYLDVEDLTQQQETEGIYGNLELGSRKPNYYQQNAFGRKPTSADLTQHQQTEDLYGNFDVVSRRSTTRKPNGYLQRNPDAEDLTQQQETEDIYSNLELGSRRPNYYQQNAFGRKPTSADLTQQQQTEDLYGNFDVVSRKSTTTKPNGYLQKNPDAEDLTQQQQTEDIYGYLGVSSRKPNYYQQNVFGNKPASADLTQQQQTEDIFGNYKLDSRRSTTRRPGSYLQNNPDVGDLTQQQETEDIYANLGLGLGRTTTIRPGFHLNENLQQQQQTEDIFGKVQPQSDDLTQQQETEDIYGNLHLASRSSTTRKPNLYQQSIQHDDLTQQQQTEDIYGSLGLNIRTTTTQPSSFHFGDVELNSGSSQYRGDIPKQKQQQEEDVLPQSVVPLAASNQQQQQQQETIPPLRFPSQTKPSSNNQADLTQQLEDGFEGFSQHAVDEPIGRQDGSPSYYPPSYQNSRTSPYSGSSSNIQQAQQHTIEDPSEEIEDLVQKPIDKHNAYVVYDVSPQAEVREQLQEQENQPQPQPGFWKRFGNKITNAYGNVRDKAREVFG